MSDYEVFSAIRNGYVRLPVELDFNSFEQLWDNLIEAANYASPIKLYCTGIGGFSGGAAAICDLITQLCYGEGIPVIGVAAGQVCSANSVIWAACPQRICMPSGYLLVHQVARINDSVRHETDMASESEVMRYMNHRMAEIYAEASVRSISWWENLLGKSTQTGTLLNRRKLVELGMIEEL